MKPVRVVLCGGQGSFGRGLQANLGSFQDVQLLSLAGTGAEALVLCQELGPDILLLLDVGVSGPCAANVLAILGKTCPQVKTLMVADNIEEERLLRYLALGAMGCFQAGDPPARLLWDISAAVYGYYRIRPEVVQHMGAMAVAEPLQPCQMSISPRQMEILKLLHQGWSYEDIARKLCITVSTVRYHLNSLMAELGVQNKFEAVSAAVSLGWIAPPQKLKK
jgi:DNA-binding NarL/FixJ family response regulator